MDRFPVPMPRPLRLAAALLIASVVVGCEPAQDEFDLSTVATIPTAESNALVALYDSMDGDNWNNNTGWLLSADPCSWREVTCSSGHVIRLDLVLNNLTGSIPPELGNLTDLTGLYLFSNELSGVVPLPVAVLGGKLQQSIALSRCRFESNPGLSMPASQDYMDADLDNDGVICGIALSTPTS